MTWYDLSIPSKFAGKIRRFLCSSATASIALRHSEVQPPTRTSALSCSIRRRACDANAEASDRPSAISHFKQPAGDPAPGVDLLQGQDLGVDQRLLADRQRAGLRVDQADDDRRPGPREQPLRGRPPGPDAKA